MMNTDKTTSADGLTISSDVGLAATRPGRAPLWLGVASVLAPFLAFRFFPAVGLGAVTGVIAVVLSIRARGRGRRGGAMNWATALGVIGAVVDTAVVIALTVMLTSGPSSIELQADGGDDFTVAFSDDRQDYVEVWDTSWFGKFTTRGDTAEITVTPAPGNAPQTHSCRILWNEAVVVEESSGSGPVTCHYEK